MIHYSFGFRRGLLVWVAAIWTLSPSLSLASEPKFEVTSVVEKKIPQLPPGPLFWRVDNFPTLADAQAAAGPTGLAAEVAGKVWLFTLGPKGRSSLGGSAVAEIGPVPPISAPEYLLRINSSGGPPGAKTPVHMHPGSETFYVLSGELSQKSPHGVSPLRAGQFMPGHGPGMPMEISSSGTTDLRALVMFVVDATKPFSIPATLPGAVAQTDLVGVWSLQSDVTVTSDGRKLWPFGPNPKGIAIFDGTGHFAIVTSRPDLPKFASDNRMQGTAEENEAIVRGSIAFFGTYSVKDDVIVQHIEGGTWPSWVGTDQNRTITSFANDEQTWTTIPSFGGKSELRWRRVN
ncbi:MAG TPA: lipocalin-like domain-containing protein [Pseudolabrys sp.]|nr:lipocalin-like domain-containing protein [Pseudolabrys sp.]